MFGGVIERSDEWGYLAGDGGDVDDVEEGFVGRRIGGGGGGGG